MFIKSSIRLSELSLQRTTRQGRFRSDAGLFGQSRIPRSIRIYHTLRRWWAVEVRDAWARGDYVFEPGELRRIPNPPLCEVSP